MPYVRRAELWLDRSEPVKAEAEAPVAEEKVAAPEDFKDYSDDYEAEVAPEAETK